jgi:hypothetical protein
MPVVHHVFPVSPIAGAIRKDAAGQDIFLGVFSQSVDTAAGIHWLTVNE